MGTNPVSPAPDGNDDPQSVDARSIDHTPDARAAISAINGTFDAYPGGTPQVLPAIVPDHDAAGNLTYDGTYIYQYDGWSRLVQVNLAAQPPPGGGPAVGDSVPGTTQLAGPLVKHFTYDGLGRLVRVLSPYPEPGATPPEGWTTAPVRSERLYYDGVRRIQEVYTDPLLALGESAAQGDPEAQGEVSQGGEEEGQTLEGEEGQIEQGSGEPGGEEPPGPPPNTFITYLEREYLWGPGDGITGGAGAGLDELIGIFDIDRRAWWTLLDASGDVVAIVDDDASTTHGFGTGSSSTSTARLCAQFCYDAYGSLLTVQGLHPFLDPRTGHKGLHLDRLDVGVVDPVSGAPIARHEVGATHSYFVRNRHYSPHLGRLLQRDPNATGAAVLGSLASLGRGIASGGASLELATHLTDGVGVFGWLSGEGAWRSSDPLGLFGFNIPDVLGAVALEAGSQAHEMYMELNGRIAESRLFRITTEFGHDSAAYIDWATDWSLDDDLFEQPIEEEEEAEGTDDVEFAMGFPSRRAIDGAIDGFRAAKKLSRGHARLGEVIETYAEARTYTRGKGGSIQAHHLIEKRMTGRGQLFEGLDPELLPSAILTGPRHLVITNSLRRDLPYGATYTDGARVWAAYQRAYRDYPEFLAAIEKYFRNKR